MISNWATKGELILMCRVKPSKIDKIIKELILQGFIEADYSNWSDPKFRFVKTEGLLNKIKIFLAER